MPCSFFDPTTHLLMAEDSGGVGSADQHSTTIYNVAIVGSTDATPSADQWLFPEAPQPSPSQPVNPCECPGQPANDVAHGFLRKIWPDDSAARRA